MRAQQCGACEREPDLIRLVLSDMKLGTVTLLAALLPLVAHSQNTAVVVGYSYKTTSCTDSDASPIYQLEGRITGIDAESRPIRRVMMYVAAFVHRDADCKDRGTPADVGQCWGWGGGSTIQCVSKTARQ